MSFLRNLFLYYAGIGDNFIHPGEQLNVVLQRICNQLTTNKKRGNILVNAYYKPMLSLVTKKIILRNFWSIWSCCKEPDSSACFLKSPWIFWLLRQLVIKPETPITAGKLFYQQSSLKLHLKVIGRWMPHNPASMGIWS